MPLDPRQFAAGVAAELCLAITNRGRALGVFAEQLPPLDPETFVSRLGAGSSRPLRVALLGIKKASLKPPANIQLTYSPTDANKWRNDKEARAGKPCVTLVLGSAPKINSLRSAVTVVTVDDFRQALVERAVSWLDTPERSAFWNALGDSPGDVPLSLLLHFAAAVDGQRRTPATLLDQEPKLVHHLGLLRYKPLLAGSGVRAARSALRRDLELVARLRQLPTREKGAVSSVLDGDEPKRDDPRRRMATAILQYERTGDREQLEGLDFDSVKQLLSERLVEKGPTPEPAGKGEDANGTREKRERLDGDALALELMLDADGRGVGVAAKRFKGAVEPDEEGGIEPDEITVGQRHILPHPKAGTAQATGLFGRLLTEENWGGIVTAAEAADFVAALKLASSGDVQASPFRPGDDEQVRWMLSRAVNQGLVTPDALAAWDEYAGARRGLLPHAVALTDHPLLAIAGTQGLRDKAERLLTFYAAALDAVRRTGDALKQNGSIEAHKRLLARFLCLDVAFVRSAGDFNAVAAPTHPFHLWRWLTLHDVISTYKQELADIGMESLEPLVTEPPASAPHLVLSPFAADGKVDRAKAFVAIGSFGALPLFGEPSARQLGKFRARSLGKIAERFVRLMPHASFGLRVLLVDPPSVAGAVEDLLEVPSAFDEEGPVPLHVTIARTRATRESTDEEDQDLELIARDLHDAGGSLTVTPGVRPLRDLAKQLENQSIHISVVFDPGEGQELRVGISDPPLMSPLLLPRAYRYDAFDDRLDVVIAGEAEPFIKYHELFCESLDLPRTDFVGRRSGASRHAKELETIAFRSIWMVVVDQGLEPTIRINGAMRLDWRSDAGRDLVTFTGHPETVEELVADAVRQAGLVANEETVKRTLRQLFQLSGEALLGLARARPDASLADARVSKGAMGVLAAARWYEQTYPDSILISLDDPLSRRWVLGREVDDRHGDLLGVRIGAEGVVVEAVEVKAHDDPDAGIKQRGGNWEGKAAVQVDQTIRVLQAVLKPEVASAIDRARRDILRDQLYRAVASRPYSSDQRARLVRMLEETFSKGPQKVGGLVFRVTIASGRAATAPSAPQPGRSPSGNALGIIDLTETEVGLAPQSGLHRLADARRRRTSPQGDAGVQPHANEGAGRGTGQNAEHSDGAGADAVAKTATPSAISILIGHTATGDQVVWEPHQPGNPLNNFGMLVTGDPGAGKTQVLRALISEVVKAGLPVCVFDFKNDYAAADFSKTERLKVYDVNRDGLPFNPLSLVADARGEVQPIRQVHELSSILRRIFGLGDQQEAQLRDAMRQAYDHHGIDPKAFHKVANVGDAPAFEEVVGVLGHDPKSKALLNRLSPLFDLNLFPGASGARTTFESLLQERVVVDLHELPNNQIKAAIAEFIIVRLHGHVLRGEQPRELRRLLVFDEAWRVSQSVRLQELAREGRAFGVGIAIGTQFPGDLPENLAGNMATQLLLQNMDPDHQKVVVRTLCGTASGQTASQLFRSLNGLQKHEGFFRNQHYAPYVLVQTLPYYQRGG